MSCFIKAIKCTTALIIVLTAFLSMAGTEIYAQEIGISQEPSYLEILAQPGRTISEKIIVGNTGDTQAFMTSIHNFTPNSPVANYEAELTGPIRFNLKNKDIQFNKPYFVKEKTGKELALEIRIPDNTPDGDYYYTITTTHETGRLPEGITSVSHKVHLNSMILLTVSSQGLVEQNGSIAEFRINSDKKFFQTKDDIPFKLIINNNGKNLIKTHGYLHIQGPGVNKRVPLVTDNVLAASQRQLVTSAGDKIDGFFIGRYTIDVFVDTGSNVMRARTSFIAVPVTLIALLVLITGLLYLARIVLTKKDHS